MKNHVICDQILEEMACSWTPEKRRAMAAVYARWALNLEISAAVSEQQTVECRASKTSEPDCICLGPMVISGYPVPVPEMDQLRLKGRPGRKSSGWIKVHLASWKV